MHPGESMDMEKCVHACGAEVDKRPCGVSWGMHVCPGRHPSLLEFCGEGWISLPPAKHLLTQFSHWNLPCRNPRVSFPC